MRLGFGGAGIGLAKDRFGARAGTGGKRIGFARLDLKLVSEAIHLDSQVNTEYQSVTRQLITYMMEDPRTITRSLDILTIAKAIERIGDHAVNIAEWVIYLETAERIHQKKNRLI